MTEADLRTAEPRRPGPGRDAVRTSGHSASGRPTGYGRRLPQRPGRLGIVALAGALALGACPAGQHADSAYAVEGALHHPGDGAGSAARHPVESLRVEVLQTLPHDPKAFTEGLEMSGGTLYESTGLPAQSSVRAGTPGKAPKVRATLPAPLFGEGITLLGQTLWQLTWRDRIALERDAKTLAEVRRVPYPDDGWGMCLQRARRRLVTSDGSARLTFRDPHTLARTGDVVVTDRGHPVSKLNELECAGAAVYANVLFTDRIVRIDPASGAVTASIDASGLIRGDELAPGATLNGIAAIPGTDQFLITGKFWPTMFRVTFVPARTTGGPGQAERRESRRKPVA